MIEKIGALYNDRYRVIVSTDIGGSDEDDFQSMVHFFLYSYLFDVEGLISSAWGNGRIKDIYDVIDAYELDYDKLKKYSDKYPTPDYLRSITKQGEINFAPYKGYSNPTDGSRHIIECAKRNDERPLYILGWGLLEDIAQALHDEPSIINKIRVIYIGGPNKKWGCNAYQYIRENFPNLWIIENNSSYRGWINDVEGNEYEYTNKGFVEKYVKNSGALGKFFSEKCNGEIRMGDTPTVTYLLNGNPEKPSLDSWGGKFVKVYNRPEISFDRDTTKEDRIEMFSIIEYVFNGPIINHDLDKPAFMMKVKNQYFEGFYQGNGIYKIRFMPKSLGLFEYEIISDIKELNHKGAFISIEENKKNRKNKGQNLTNWHSDSLNKKYKDGIIYGAKTINKYRKEYLDDFKRLLEVIK